jgi:hypothetical protein
MSPAEVVKLCGTAQRDEEDKIRHSKFFRKQICGILFYESCQLVSQALK